MAFLCATWLCSAGCVDDPQDPKTWIKQLDDPREQREAVRQLAKLKSDEAFEPLVKLFKKNHDPELVKIIGSFRSEKAVDFLIEQLDYSTDDFETAEHAAIGLRLLAERDDKGREAARKAVDPLIKAIGKKLPIKTKANVVKAEAMHTLGVIKDARAVDALDQVLETSADEQDFFLNKEAAKYLGELQDPRSVPSLVRGLFMTGRGANIFQPCRLALVRIGGDAAVDKLVQTLQRKNPTIEEDAKKYQFIPGVIAQKMSILLGDLRNKKAVPALLGELGKKDEGLAPGGVSGHQSVLQALGLIAEPSSAKEIMRIAADPKANPKHRAAAAAALNFMNAKEALPVLLAGAKTTYFDPKKKEIDQDKAMLAAQMVTEYSRLLATDDMQTLLALMKSAPPETDVQIAFRNAAARSQVVLKCKQDAACYGEMLHDKASARSEKAAFMLGRLGRAGLPHLLRGIDHADSATRFAVLFALTRVANKNDKDVQKALADQIDRDKTKEPLRVLVDEMYVTQAIISHLD